MKVVNMNNKAIFLQSQFSEKKLLQGHITHAVCIIDCNQS